jgi:hypothetical protein
MNFKVGDRVKYKRCLEVAVRDDRFDAPIGVAPLLCSLCVAAADGVAFASFKCTTCNDGTLFCTPHQQLHMNSVSCAGHIFEKIDAPVRQIEIGLLESQQQQSTLKWHDKGFEAIVTEVGNDNDAIILMQAGPTQGTKFLVRTKEIALLNHTDEIAQSVAFESRSSANMARIREFLLKLYGCDSSMHPQFTAAVKKFQERTEKDGSEGFWNDHHIVMLQDQEHEEELDQMLGTGRGKDFRLLCLDAVHTKVVLGPNSANEAEIQAAAVFCRNKQAGQKRMPYGTLSKCQQWWLRHRNVRLETNWLQRAIKAINDAENPDIKRFSSVSGPKAHLSDLTFAKHVVPIMRSTGNLKAPLSTWRRVMSAVHLLEQGLVDVEADADGQVQIGGNADLVREAWKGALDADAEWPKDDRTAKEYLERFGLNSRTGEQLGVHRLAVDADCVEDVFDTLEQRISELGITKNENILLVDELREHKDFERVKDALKVVQDSETKRSFVTALERITAGATAVPVTDLLGNHVVVQFVCVDKKEPTTTGVSTKVDPAMVSDACRQAGFTCRILVSYSDTGYATSETNAELKKAVIEVMGKKQNPFWEPGMPLSENVILIEDGASLHNQDLELALHCVTSGLYVHHSASNSTHFGQVFDRHPYKITKGLVIRELALRILAMREGVRPVSGIAQITWYQSIMNTVVVPVIEFEQHESLADVRQEFAKNFKAGNESAEDAMKVRLSSIFDVAERGKCDEFFVIHALAFALFAGLQSRYVVKSSVMCGLLPEDFELPRDRVRPVCINRAAVMSNPLVVNSKRRKHNEQAYLLLLQS